MREEAAVVRSWGEMAAESLGGRSVGGGCGRQDLGRGGDREHWERSVGEEAASSGVGARWRQRALGTAESLGNAPWVRVRVWSPGVGGEVAADCLGNVRWGRRLRSQGVAASWATAPRGQMGRRLTCSV